jgi:hypothetical protein
VTTTENETTESNRERRVRVTYEPVPGVKPWRAVIEARVDGELLTRQAVGRFDTAAEANTTGVSALRFVNAGIAWRPVGEPEVEVQP